MRTILWMAAMCVAMCLAQPARAGEQPVKIGEVAPAFELMDQNGKSVKLNEFASKIVVLEWTNPECPFVQRHYEDKTMLLLNDKYKDKGVVWLAINSGAGTTVADNKKWSDAQHIPYPVLDDSSGTIGRAFGAKSTPHMFIIDASGRLVYRGGIDNDPSGDKGIERVNYIDQALAELTSGKPVSIAETKSYGCGVEYK